VDQETKDFIIQTLQTAVNGLRSEVNTSLGTVVSAVQVMGTELKTLKEKPATEPPTVAAPEESELAKTVAELKQQLADRDRNDLKNRFSSELADLIGANKDIRSTSIVKDLFAARYGEKIEPGSNGFNVRFSDTEVKPLTELFNNFFKSDEGKELLVARRPRGTDPIPTSVIPPTATTAGETPKEPTSLDAFTALVKANREQQQAVYSN